MVGCRITRHDDAKNYYNSIIHDNDDSIIIYDNVIVIVASVNKTTIVDYGEID